MINKYNRLRSRFFSFMARNIYYHCQINNPKTCRDPDYRLRFSYSKSNPILDFRIDLFTGRKFHLSLIRIEFLRFSLELSDDSLLPF